jgi:hypothetical protein
MKGDERSPVVHRGHCFRYKPLPFASPECDTVELSVTQQFPQLGVMHIDR